MLGHRAQLIAEHNEDHRSPKRSQEMMNPSENRHHHRIAGMLPIEVVRIDALDQKREQRSGKTNNRRRQHERAELVACGAVPRQRTRCPLSRIACKTRPNGEWTMRHTAYIPPRTTATTKK